MQTTMFTHYLLATILLDKNRWASDGKVPGIAVSDWLDSVGQAGFDGVELWQYHMLEASPREQTRLVEKRAAIDIFSTYFDFSDEHAALRTRCTAAARSLDARAVKYNIGANKAQTDTYRRNLTAWRGAIDADSVPLCECHPGTIVDTPETARAFFDSTGVHPWPIIIHPFSLPGLDRWLELFGPDVRHAHLQVRDGKKVVPFSEHRTHLRAALKTMRAAGFRGSASFEFTAGANTPGDCPEWLLANATKDLAVLKDLVEDLA